MTVLMMLLNKTLTMLLLFLTLELTLRLTHALSTTSPITRPRILFMTPMGDYDEDYDDSDSPIVAAPAGPTRLLHELCRYDPCREDQPPCKPPTAQSGCLCPGLSGAHEIPHSPRLQRLGPSSGSDNGVEVQWCAPSSVVSGYRLVVRGNRNGALEFGAQARRGRVQALEAGAEVCVEAVNRAGHSTASELSCTHYHPPVPLSDSVKVGLIMGGVAILLLLVVIVPLILWRHRVRKRLTEGSGEGLGNPSYSTEGNL